MRRNSGIWPACLILALSGCTLPGPTGQQPIFPGPPPGQESPLAMLPGWNQDNLAAALATFVLSCKTLALMPPDQPLGGTGMAAEAGGQAGLWQPSCNAAEAVTPGDNTAARGFFEANFTAYTLPGPALITGYFEPEYRGAKNYSRGYTVPLYARPALASLTDLPRAAIDNGALTRKAPVTAYLASAVDAFMLQIQGSGRILLPNGQILRVGFDGQNGQPYTPIGRILVQNGELQPDDVSFQSIVAWLNAHPDQAKGIMEQNARYVFLRPLGPLPTDEGAPGSLGVPLTAGRSLAIDKTVIPLGMPVFLSTTNPLTNAPLQRLTIAQDTGGGIQGPNRADLFFGAGPQAEAIAGSMQQPGQLTILLPKPAATPASQ
ncbi:murein transglycosylase A [Acidocella sp.]|uniref:murein transglycosylase A n=1 Tax=Acidocella sp. TaxID=50710 RepID=UPI00260650DF|nr:MltA domain-containing protein [Acidocella sp.]